MRGTAHEAPGVSTARVARSIQALTLGMVRGQNTREQIIETIRAGETEQQYKVPISGIARPEMQWVESEIKFNDAFIPGTDRRDSTFTQPVFTFGYVIPSGVPVMVTACVRKWDQSGEGMVSGCTVAVGVINFSFDEVSFKGEVHLVFQGYAAPTILEAD